MWNVVFPSNLGIGDWSWKQVELYDNFAALTLRVIHRPVARFISDKTVYICSSSFATYKSCNMVKEDLEQEHFIWNTLDAVVSNTNI